MLKATLAVLAALVLFVPATVEAAGPTIAWNRDRDIQYDANPAVAPANAAVHRITRDTGPTGRITLQRKGDAEDYAVDSLVGELQRTSTLPGPPTYSSGDVRTHRVSSSPSSFDAFVHVYTASGGSGTDCAAEYITTATTFDGLPSVQVTQVGTTVCSPYTP